MGEATLPAAAGKVASPLQEAVRERGERRGSGQAGETAGDVLTREPASSRISE